MLDHCGPDGCTRRQGQALRSASEARISGSDHRGRESMRQLSISAAWEEAKAILQRDGGLLLTVALALVALPSLASGLVNPPRMSASSSPWLDLITRIASVVARAGQPACIRRALGPSVTVG